MSFSFDQYSDTPIYQQFAELIEENILKGIYEEETQIPSTTEVSMKLKINPATANRGVNLLVEEGIIYKKRGVGMFVCEGARNTILEKRKRNYYKIYVEPLLEEAAKLGISEHDIIEMIRSNISK